MPSTEHDPLETIDPTTGCHVASYEQLPDTELERRIERATIAARSWRTSAMAERASLLRSVARVLEDRRDPLAELMATEMGKPLADGRAEVDKSAWVCRYYAEHGANQLADEPVATDHYRSYVHYEPLGVVLAVMPWNFPLWQVMRFAAPALMAGNVGLLKHASNVTGASLEIEDVLATAGAEPGLFSSLVIGSDRVGGVVKHPGVRAVTLTGSERAGRAVAATAAGELKPTLLELGGSDPYVVLADADIEHAAEVCATARLLNSGQSCIAGKRFIIERPVHDEFVDALAAEFSRRVVGSPFEAETDLGPMARRQLRHDLHDQVRGAVAAGARLVCGGELPDGPGAFYPPTILTGVQPGMTVADEEVFGPVAAVLSAVDATEAIELANASEFGLGAAVLTGDTALGEEIAAHRLEAGLAFVNTNVASDPRLPFGGIKRSGYGRELATPGIRSFVNTKTVVVADGPTPVSKT